MNPHITIGDLVRIAGASPYFGRLGLVIFTRQSYKEVYYHVLLSGNTQCVPFREPLLRVIRGSTK